MESKNLNESPDQDQKMPKNNSNSDYIDSRNDDNAIDEYRNKQIRELEMLQRVIDENNALRAKYNALQMQVPPLVETVSAPVAAAGSQYQSERQISPEEVENFKQQLENTLLEYRKATQNAGKLNQQLERQYTNFNNLKMQTRLLQDEKINRQDQISNMGLTNFRSKIQRVKEQWSIERQRLSKSISFLKNIYDTSSADIREFEEQMRANNKGITHLSSSIQIAKEDICEFTKQIEEIKTKLKQFEKLQKEEEQQKEDVILSDDISGEFINNLIQNYGAFPSSRRYSNSIYDISYLLYLHSNITYKILRSIVPLTSEQMLREKLTVTKENLLNSYQINVYKGSLLVFWGTSLT